MSGLMDSPEGQLGEIAVRHVKGWLNERGWLVLPVDRIEMNGAPGFVGDDGRRITVPDLLAAANGRSRWVEVKWKESCELYQKTRTWRTGVDVGKWRNYLRVQNATSIPGWLAIVQLKPGKNAPINPVLLLAPFTRLAPKATPHNGGGDVKVWWDVDVFDCYPMKLDDTGTRFAKANPIVHPWEGVSSSGVAPKWTPNPQLRLF